MNYTTFHKVYVNQTTIVDWQLHGVIYPSRTTRLNHSWLSKSTKETP